MAPPLDQFFPPSATFTDKHAGDQGGRVFLITGGNSGLGFELAKMLYGLNATVYIASRSVKKTEAAIQMIRTEVRTKAGRVEGLKLDLENLVSIRQSAHDFLAREERLDVLVHNAGIMVPPAGSKTDLGHDLQMGTNCLGPFLLNRFLEPILKQTAKSMGGVRVVWLSSIVATSVPPGGIDMNSDGSPKVLKNQMVNYMQTKVGNLFLATETAQRLGQDGILSVSVNPGFLTTSLQRNVPAPVRGMMHLFFGRAQNGAYSELFASISPDVTMAKNGAFIIPYGRFGQVPGHIQQSIDKGKAALFYQWCDRETKTYQ